MTPDTQPAEPNHATNASTADPNQLSRLLGAPLSRARALEDGFANAGLLGLPEPTDLLRNFDTARDSLVEAEASLVAIERTALEAREQESAAIRQRLCDEETRTLSQLNDLDRRCRDLRSREGEVRVAHAAVTSNLAAKRALYPERLAERTARAAAQRRRQLIEALRDERELRGQATPLTIDPAEQGAIRDRSSALRAMRAAQGDVEEIVLRLERVGLSHAVAGAVLWAGAGGVLTSGWLSATWLRAGPLSWSGIAGLDTGTAAGAGVCVAAMISAAVLAAMAIAASRVATNQAAHPATPLWIPLAIAGSAVTATPLLIFTGTIPPTSALALAAIALAASSLSTGLYLRGLYGARDVRRRETQQAEAALVTAVEIASGPFSPRRMSERVALTETASPVEAQSQPSSGSTSGDSTSDALFEPELLAQLCHHAATREQIEAELEDARTTRAAHREILARILTELGTVQAEAKTEREEHLRRIRAHADRILQWREEQATLELNVKSAYSMGRSLRPHSDTRILEETHAALTA